MELKIQGSAFLESIYYGSAQPIFVVDVTREGDFRFAGLNPAHEKVTGMRSEDVEGKSPEELVPMVPPEAAEAIRKNYTTCLEKGSIYEYEEMIPILGKETHWLTRLTPLKDESGQICRIVGNATEISAKVREIRKAKEEYLQKLGESERIFRNIAENFLGVAYRLNERGVPQYLFGSVKKITGYAPEDLTGNRKWKQLMHREDRDKLEKAYPPELFKDPGYACTREYRLVRKDGSVCWVSDMTQVVEDEKSGVPVIQGAIRDLTPWKEAELAVRLSEKQSSQKTAELIERVKEINCLHEVSALTDIHENSPRELLKNAVEKLPPAWQYPEITEARILYRDQIYKTSGFRESEWMQEAPITMQGTRCGSVSVAYLEERPDADEGPFLQEERQLIETLALELGDALEKHGAHVRLKESEERYRTLFESARDMIHIVDATGKITHANRAEQEVLGYSEEQLVGSKFTDHVDPGYLERTQEIFAKVRQGHSVENYDTVMQSRSGRKIEVQVSVVPQFREGEFVSACAIIRDQTDLRRIHRELAEANEKLTEKNRELEQIVYVTSHDLRSPLVNIQGFNQELEMSIGELKNSLSRVEIPEDLRTEIDLVMDEEIPESIDFIKSGTTKMDALLKGLLAISRLGRKPLEYTPVDMNAMADEILKTFHFQIKEKNIKTVIKELPACEGDPHLLSQVFSNLVGNAIKFMDADTGGQITLSGTNRSGNIEYRVEDTGPGIPEEKHEKIFEIFHRHDSGKPGEGLGLTIVRKIVDRHRGRIEVKSKPGKGCTFIVSFPETKPN